MRNLKLKLSILALSGLVFTSCMDEKKATELDASGNEIELNSKTGDNPKLKDKLGTKTEKSRTNKTMVYNKVTSKDGKVVERSMNNEVHAMQISGWSGFNTLSIEMKKLENADFNTIKAALPNFDKTIASLDPTRPDWMKTREIGKDIADVQKEYKALMSKDNTNDRKYKRDLEELNEAYDDLVEEINETFDKYVKINRKANEEYSEEIEDDGDLDDAREEYNEEIKKLNKVADDKK